MVSPPRFQSIHPVILGVCHELGIDEVYRLGGVQAVGALAYGTQTIRKVDKIVRAGQQVGAGGQAARRRGLRRDRFDRRAHSEVLIVANDQANPAWVAADMLSQAEHGTDSSAVLTDLASRWRRPFSASCPRQLATLPRAPRRCSRSSGSAG